MSAAPCWSSAERSRLQLDPYSPPPQPPPPSKANRLKGKAAGVSGVASPEEPLNRFCCRGPADSALNQNITNKQQFHLYKQLSCSDSSHLRQPPIRWSQMSEVSQVPPKNSHLLQSNHGPMTSSRAAAPDGG